MEEGAEEGRRRTDTHTWRKRKEGMDAWDGTSAVERMKREKERSGRGTTSYKS